MFRLLGKKIITILRSKILLNWTYAISSRGFKTYCNFFKKLIGNTIRASNNLDPDQDRHSVGPDLDPKCLQCLSAEDKSRC